MPPVSRGEGENPGKMGQLVCGIPGTLSLFQGSILVLILLHGVASTLHQPAHSPLCPVPGAPQCPELTRSRAHLHHRSHGWAMELFSPLLTPAGVQHRAPHVWVLVTLALPITLIMGKLWRQDDPTHPGRWSPL